MLFIRELFMLIFWYFTYLNKICDSRSMPYIDVERPVLTYLNSKYAKYVIITSYRVSRKDPRHYLNFYGQSRIVFGNNVKVDVYFYQFLTNRYRPSFVELHTPFCDFLSHDKLLGPAFNRSFEKLNVKCPLPPGEYNLTHLLVPPIPKNFPFTRGRIIFNTSVYTEGAIQPIGSAYIDMEIKQMRINET